MFLLEQVVNGLVLGGYYLLIALGLSLIFSVGGVVNLAHGAFYAFGAYIAVQLTDYVGFGPAIVVSPVAVGVLGILFERFILRRFYTADPILSLLVTFGLALMAEQLLRIIWGAAPLSQTMPQGLKGAVFIGDFLDQGLGLAGTEARRGGLSRRPAPGRLPGRGPRAGRAGHLGSAADLKDYIQINPLPVSTLRQSVPQALRTEEFWRAKLS